MGALESAARFIAHNPGTVTGLGAGLGAAGSIAREAMKGPEEPKSYLGAGVRGAIAGTALGGGLAGASHVMNDARLLNPGMGMLDATRKHVGEGISNFAQRQLHGFTGYGGHDTDYLDRIGIAGRSSARQEIDLMRKRFADAAPRGGNSPAAVLEHEKALRGVRAQGEAAQRFQDLGMTSLPGAVRGVINNPRESSKAIWNQLRSGGKAGVALGLGVPAAMSGIDLARGDERATGGQSLQQKAVRAGTNIGTGLLFAGVPVATQALTGLVTDPLAGRIGRALTPSRSVVASPAG